VNLWQRLFGADRRRQRALRAASPGPLRELLAQPWPDRRTLCRDAVLVALDLEATGLNPQQDHMVSVGLVELHGMTIHLDTALHRLIRTKRPMPEDTAIIHQVTDDQVANGLALDEILPEILERLTGRILLAHHAWVEQSFLSAACERLYGAPLVMPTIDTQALAQRLMRNRNQFVRSTSLRLFNLRSYYGLPRYKAHNALSDALATAELFLALAEDIQPGGDCRLGQVLTH
jgi:DNA polymerase-3 subunit epsilon